MRPTYRAERQRDGPDLQTDGGRPVDRAGRVDRRRDRRHLRGGSGRLGRGRIAADGGAGEGTLDGFDEWVDALDREHFSITMPGGEVVDISLSGDEFRRGETEGSE